MNRKSLEKFSTSIKQHQRIQYVKYQQNKYDEGSEKRNK